MSDIPDDNLIPDMDFSLEGVDPGRPVCAPGTYVARVTFKRAPNKDSNGFNFEIDAVLQGEVFSNPSTADGSQKPLENHKITTYMPLQAKKGAKDPDQFKKNLAAFADACGGTDMSTRPAQPPWNDYQNALVLVEVVTEKDEKFGLGNKIAKWMHYDQSQAS